MMHPHLQGWIFFIYIWILFLGTVPCILAMPPDGENNPYTCKSPSKRPVNTIKPLGRRAAHPHGSGGPNKKKAKTVPTASASPWPPPAPQGVNRNNPALKINGDIRDIWAKECEDGYYDWDWKKYNAWCSCNWNHLTDMQKLAAELLRDIYLNPEIYGSKHNERHHMIPRSLGGRPTFSQEHCVSLTCARHLLAHVCLAILLPHHLSLHRGVGMCMIGFSQNIISLENILRTAGAPECIASQVGGFRQKARETAAFWGRLMVDDGIGVFDVENGKFQVYWKKFGGGKTPTQTDAAAFWGNKTFDDGTGIFDTNNAEFLKYWVINGGGKTPTRNDAAAFWGNNAFEKGIGMFNPTNAEFLEYWAINGGDKTPTKEDAHLYFSCRGAAAAGAKAKAEGNGFFDPTNAEFLEYWAINGGDKTPTKEDAHLYFSCRGAAAASAANHAAANTSPNHVKRALVRAQQNQFKKQNGYRPKELEAFNNLQKCINIWKRDNPNQDRKGGPTVIKKSNPKLYWFLHAFKKTALKGTANNRKTGRVVDAYFRWINTGVEPMTKELPTPPLPKNNE